MQWKFTIGSKAQLNEKNIEVKPQIVNTLFFFFMPLQVERTNEQHSVNGELNGSWQRGIVGPAEYWSSFTSSVFDSV